MDSTKNFTSYKAKIGGLFYENVTHPLIIGQTPLIELRRSEDTQELLCSFSVTNEKMESVAIIKENKIMRIDHTRFFDIHGMNRFSIIEKKTNKIWCDLQYRVLNEDYELELSLSTHISKNFPLFLHPNRTIIGKPNRNQGPNISRLKLEHASIENITSGIVVGLGMDCYILGVYLVSFSVGVEIETSLFKK